MSTNNDAVSHHLQNAQHLHFWGFAFLVFLSPDSNGLLGIMFLLGHRSKNGYPKQIGISGISSKNPPQELWSHEASFSSFWECSGSSGGWRGWGSWGSSAASGTWSKALHRKTPKQEILTARALEGSAF